MNGFVRFDRDEALRTFLDAPEVAELDSSDRLERSRREPLVIFKDLSPEEVETVRRATTRSGGRVVEATRYSPLA